MQLSLMAFLQQAEQLDQQQDSIAPSCLLSAGPIVSLSPEDVEELTAAFIMENVSDRKMRLQRNRKLAQQTIAFGYLQASIITELALTHTWDTSSSGRLNSPPQQQAPIIRDSELLAS